MAAPERRVTLDPPAKIAPQQRGTWCILRAGCPQDASAYVAFYTEAHEPVGDRVYLRRVRGRSAARVWGVGFVPAEAAQSQLVLLGHATATDCRPVELRPIRSLVAASLLIGQHPAVLARALRRFSRGHVRSLLASLAASNNRPHDYKVWIKHFDRWTHDEFAATAPSIVALIIGAGRAALSCTLASLDAQFAPMPHLIGTDLPAWHAALAARGEDYVAVLQAGETLPPHASLLAWQTLEALGWPEIAYADEDALSQKGERHAPHFKPEPSHALMLSGTLARGAWFVRRDVLRHFPDLDASWAETLRLDLWLRRYAAGGVSTSRRIPYVLTHRRPEAESAPAAALARIVNAHCGRMRLPMVVEPILPLRLRNAGPATSPRITVIVPSACRAPHVARCISAVLARTAHRNFELVVGVSQPSPLDAAQRAVAREIERDARARIVWLPAERFNFSAVNNRIAADTSSEHVCLLNDDVSPIAADWLDHMQAHLADPRVGIVGAKLYYQNDTIQHAGVLMGLAGLCEHTNRGLPRHLAGYASRAVLAQEFSAVTAACLLVQRRVLDQLGGLDESYPSAFNDVDLCLRATEAGFAVVFAAGAELYHEELQTYGSHYAGERAPFQDDEAERMRARWADICAADPFHNPNLDLGAGREWTLAFPPRLAGPWRRPVRMSWPIQRTGLDRMHLSEN